MCGFLMIEQKSLILSWNVRGLNDSAAARRKVVKILVAEMGCTLIFLQETKFEWMDSHIITEIAGPDLHNNLLTCQLKELEGCW